ncbi:MAG: ribonuclease J [Deltaproteobacteria bacterium CG_4_8_14_3_um_filter_51_11]|nr:ribonuclease J [bacterium]PIP46956.1 MAG: ribonuclease J [Deltaproteobacteria bacterium CG23_combo_of_CG06-09_8_20_14_all_51_20]PIX18181.1 MAG: ribonuclease J [Deltaproteobacteria bacterium CG_4_8_14_3_um_filter_51_11]PIY21912.1 MAG: ribonuclease J [Deltaproteobacteria bacterium CG_4_10_14_3_um_filter_51_14]PJB37761.1 MAG: ribonuclease J [Deltaproteobacteria bacterium CG_4_9_14_3_um_filter_51_14]
MLKAIPLGGLGEIGLNMMAFEYNDRILVVDAGLMFPDNYLPGVDIVIPDFNYLRENKEKVGWLILTHGHEDHIGAVPFLLKEFNIPVYATRFTIALLKEKLKEHNIPLGVEFREIAAGDISNLGPFQLEYISVNHSIVDGLALLLKTDEGVIVHTGDFRVDLTPVDHQYTDLAKFAEIGRKGVLALFSDSTNAERDGFTMSENEVKKKLEGIFASARGRIIVALFASHIPRIQQVVDLASQFGRSVFFNGKSVVTNAGIAKELGFLKIREGIQIFERDLESIHDRELVVITTGSQGEPMSALARMAQGQHKAIKIRKGDTIILSSRFIPGNEKAITMVINSLYRLGAEVIYEKVSEIHTSGHARQEELKLMLSLVRPKYFTPIHGEYRHLVKHARIAEEMGLAPERILLIEDGTVLCFHEGSAEICGRVNTGRSLVDGKGVGDVGEMVLRDRRRLSANGVVIVLLVLDERTGESIYGPDIISRGFVYEALSGHLLEDAKCLVLEALDDFERPPRVGWNDLEAVIQKRLKRFFFDVMEKSPIIMPMIIPV